MKNANTLEEINSSWLTKVHSVNTASLFAALVVAFCLGVIVGWNTAGDDPTSTNSRVSQGPDKVTTVSSKDISSLKTIVAGGVWDAPSNTRFDRELLIQGKFPEKVTKIDISVDQNDRYRIEARIGGKYVEAHTVSPTDGVVGMVRHRITLPSALHGVEEFRISVATGDQRYAVGHFIVQ